MKYDRIYEFMANKTKNAQNILVNTKQIVFIDDQVSDYQFLATGVLPGIKVVVLSKYRDGIEQITEVLNQRNNYTSIHVVSHGSPGCLYLGNNNFSLDTLNNYKSQLKTWFAPSTSSLIPQSPSLLIYGCNVAAGDAGEKLITKLNAITGAKIAASTTPIGNANLGGDWELDVTTGFNKPNLAFTKEVQQNYAGVLIDILVDDFENGNAEGWELGIAGDTATSGIWEIDNPEQYTSFGSIIQLDPANPPSPNNTLVTGNLSGTNDDVDGGITTVHSRDFTLPANANSIDLSFYYYFGYTYENQGGGSFTARLLDASNDDVLESNLASDSVGITATDQAASWTQVNTSLTTHAGKEVYLEFTAEDVGNDDNVEVGIDDVSVTYTAPTIIPNQISGNVFLDADTDGTDDGYHETGLKGIVVTATDASGNTFSTTTAIDGAYTITSGDGSPGSLSGEVRLEYTLPTDGSLDYLAPTSAGGVDVHFVDIDAGNTVDIGFSEPDTYAVDSNLRYAISCYISGNPLHDSNANAVAIASFEFSDRSQAAATTKIESTLIKDVGSVWGLANDSESGDTYISSVLKRHMGLGPDGIGAIYLDTDMTSSDSSQVSLFYDFGALAGNDLNGSSQDVYNNNVRFPGGTTSTTSEGHPTHGSIDADVYSLIGQRGLGGIDLSEDGSEVYTINLNDRKLYSINTSGTATATALPDGPWITDSSIVPDRNDSSGKSGVARPWAVKVFRGKVYVGVVTDGSNSDGSITGANDHLTAHVFAYDGTSWESVLDSPIVLDYERDEYAGGGNGNNINDEFWHPWNTNYNDIQTQIDGLEDVQYAQPIFGDIEFDNDGSMVLSLIDRSTFQFGYANADPNDTDPTLTSERTFSQGDILRVQNNDGTYELENDGAVTDSEGTTLQGVGTTTPTGPGGKEFYEDSWNIDGSANSSFGERASDAGHTGVALNPTSGEVLYGVSDAFQFFGAGVLALSNEDGSVQGGVQVYADDAAASGGTPAKAGGLGDIELLTPTAPIEFGNRIFNDTNANGIQDPGEAGIANVTVNLFQNGSQIGTVNTDSNGQYLFGGINDTNLTSGSILPDTDYEIRIDSASTSLTGLNLTAANQESNDLIDSDAVNINEIPTINVTTGDYGENNFTLDSGFTSLDYGDAPDTGDDSTSAGDYLTTSANGGPSHFIDNNLTIGSVIDADDGTLQNTNADADDLSDATNDEDGVVFNTTLSTDSDSYSVDVSVTNETGENAVVIGWIDFDQSGTFDADETVSQAVPNGTGIQNLTLDWSDADIPIDIVSGTTYARFRLSTDYSIFTENFEGTVTGWNNGGVNTASEGQWEIGTPVAETRGGIEVQQSAFSGTGALVTSDNTNEDVDDGITTIHSPDFTLSNDAGTYEISFQYFFGLVNDLLSVGDFDFGDNNFTVNLVNSSNDNVIETLVDVLPNSNQAAVWTEFNQSYDLGAHAGQDVYLEFIAEDSSTLVLGEDVLEAGVDDIDIKFTPTTASTGQASDGEIEDYKIVVKNPIDGSGASEELTNSNAGVDDIFTGGAGQDTLTGNGGDDCFHFDRTSDGIDTITDFDSGDKIDLSDLFATGGELAGATISTNPFDDNYVVATSNGSGTIVQIDFDPLSDPPPSGNGSYNKNIVYLESFTAAMTAADFIF